MTCLSLLYKLKGKKILYMPLFIDGRKPGQLFLRLTANSVGIGVDHLRMFCLHIACDCPRWQYVHGTSLWNSKKVKDYKSFSKISFLTTLLLKQGKIKAKETQLLHSFDQCRPSVNSAAQPRDIQRGLRSDIWLPHCLRHCRSSFSKTV